MRTIIYSLALIATLTAPLTGCSDDKTVVDQKDWDTATYFNSTDEVAQSTFYKPAVGYVGDPMPFFDPKAKDFKVMYLQDFRPNQAGTYHPIWAVETKDAANYQSLGELIHCGGINEQDAALGTGSTVYNDADGLLHLLYRTPIPNNCYR